MNSIPGLGATDLSRVGPDVQTGRPQKSAPDGAGFMDTLRTTINQVDELRTDAQSKVGDLLRGDGQDIHSAMIAVEKADLAFQLMVQVRNKIVQAYQEVSRMSF